MIIIIIMISRAPIYHTRWEHRALSYTIRSGSGCTLVVMAITGRNQYSSELHPAYLFGCTSCLFCNYDGCSQTEENYNSLTRESFD